MKKANGEIVLYKAEDGSPAIDVRLEHETLWLTQDQLSQLFRRERTVITKHINNIFRTRELDAKSNVQKMHIARSDKPIKVYSLDVILAVGYRVNSKRGTQFRIWATNVLRQHLLSGYTLNEKRLLENQRQRLKELETAVALVKSVQEMKELSTTEVSGLLTVITRYTRTWLLLHQYDVGDIPTRELNQRITSDITHSEALTAIERLKQELLRKNEAGELFGCETEQRLKAVLGNVNQTFAGKELYPSIEEKAAHLLYFVIKDHPFVDGNKRIAALLFIWFLEINHYLRNAEGERKINDNALVALALLVAESDPK